MLLGRGVQFASQLAMVLVLPKVLLPEIYAQLNLLLPLAFLGSTILFGWLTGSINRYVYQLLSHEDPRARQTTFIYYGCVSILLIVIFFVLSIFTHSNYRLIPLLLVAAGLKEAVLGILNMSSNHKGYFWANCGFALSLAFFVGLCSFTVQDDLAQYLIIYCALDVLLAMVAWHRLGMTSFKPLPHFHTDVATRYFLYGFPLVIRALPIWIISVSDRYLLTFWASAQDLAAYILSYQLAGSIITIPMSFMVAIFLPKIIHIDKEKGDAAALSYTYGLLRYYVRYMAVVIIGASSLVLVVAYFVYPEYVFKPRTIIIIVIAHVIQGLVHFYNKEFELNGRTMIITKSVSIGAMTNVGLNLLLMPLFGALGAAISTLAAYSVTVIIIRKAREYRPSLNVFSQADFTRAYGKSEDEERLADINKTKTVISAPSKSSLRHHYEQAIYWGSIGWDILQRGNSRSVYILGYIKSGTNWLCHLLSSVLGLPILEPWKRQYPSLGPCVFHMHRFLPFKSVRRRTIYLMRDVRDTVVSAYFHAVREGGNFRKEIEKYLGVSITKENIRDNLPGFIRYMQTNHIASTDYRTHIEQWRRHREQYVTLRYEDMLMDVEGHLSRAIQDITGDKPDADKIKHAVSQHDFERVTKRTKGAEDVSSFMRKGISGDWRNYFSAEAARVLDAYAGDLLIELGYEQDHGWVNTCQ